MRASNYDMAMSDEYVDLDAAAEAMYEEAGKPDDGKQAVVEDQQEQIEDKAEGQAGEETAEDQESEEVTSEEDKSKAKAKDDESEEDDFDQKTGDPKRIRTGKWDPVDRRAASIKAQNPGLPLVECIAMAEKQLGVSHEADSDAEPEIPDTVAQIRSTLEQKRAKLTEITTKLDASDEDYELTAKDIRKLSKEETDLKLEIQRLEIQEGQEQAEHEFRTASAAEFGARWDACAEKCLAEHPDLGIEGSRLADAMHVAMDKFSADKNHKLKGNPDAPYIILQEVIERLGDEYQPKGKAAEQAKATQKPAQKAGYRPMQGSAATAAKSASQEGITQEAVAKALQEGGPEAVAALYDADIYSGSKAANRGLGFAIA